MAREIYVPKNKSAVNNVSKKTTAKKSSKSSTKTETLDVTKNISTSIDKIENGFLITESGYVGKGKNQRWENKRYFSSENPVAGVKVKFGKK